MIFSQLDVIERLKESAPKIYHALTLALQHDLQKIENGSHQLDGDQLFMNVMTITPVDAQSKQAELHHEYIDIQLVIAGQERIEFQVSNTLINSTEYQLEGDYQLGDFADTPQSLFLSPGSFAVFYPEEAHKPGCIHQSTAIIKKVVIKLHKNYG
ncbi:N-acetylneuraminate anomerase [Aeromonas sp. 102P]|uniref:N-acetylneuraminate anomerase n=1 Tax=Aeromonas sp. 102P TaxID=3452711 RepID=UPI003F79134E